MSADRWTDCPQCGGNLREDFEVGIWDQKFYVDYGASCRQCKFKHRFKVEEPLAIEELEP